MSYGCLNEYYMSYIHKKKKLQPISFFDNSLFNKIYKKTSIKFHQIISNPISQKTIPISNKM